MDLKFMGPNTQHKGKEIKTCGSSKIRPRKINQYINEKIMYK